MVRPDLGEPGTALEITILGQRHRATVIADSPFDPDNTGRVTVGRLQAYLGRAVNLMSEGQQYAQLRSGDPEDTVLFSWASGAAETSAKAPDKPAASPGTAVVPAAASATVSTTASPPVPPPPAPLPSTPALSAPAPSAPVTEDGLPVLALHVAGMPEHEARALVASIPGVVWAAEPARARLVWLRRANASPLVTGMNLFVSFDLRREDLPAAVRTTRIVDAMALRAAKGRLSLAIARDEGGTAPASAMPVHFSGETVGITANDLPGPNLAVFNLTAKGVVQMLYPTVRDVPIAWPPTSASGGVTVLRARVEPDYGGDHVIALAGVRSLRPLIAALNALDGRAEPEAAHQAVLAAMAADPLAELSVAALYTADKARACDPEIIRDATMAARCSPPPGVTSGVTSGRTAGTMAKPATGAPTK